ncbi:MAG: MMPL family transporter [bacterium]
MRDRLLRRYARWLFSHPIHVIVAACILTAISLFLSIRYLKTQTGILDLYSENTPVNQRFLSYTRKFGAVESLILVFEGPKEEDRRRAMDALAARLQDDPHDYIKDIFYKIDLGLFQRHAFQFLSDRQAKEMLKQTQAPDGGILALFRARGWVDFLAYLNATLERGLRQGAKPSPEAAGEFGKLLRPLQLFRDFLDGKDLSGPAIAAALEESPDEKASVDAEGYLRTDDKKMHVMFLKPSDSKQDYKVDQKLIEWVRREIPPVEAQFKDVKIGVTGGPALNNDQFKISQHDMTLASVFAYASTAVIFILAFKAFARPFLGLLNLNLTLTWVFGFTTLAIGHLNLFSLAFVVILVGQGTYYGVHVIARYEEELHRGRSVAAAVEETLANVFGNITTSALTTAAAFYATTLVELRGFAELGWIAGTGVLLSALSMQLVLPAFLIVYDRRRSPAALRGPGQTATQGLKPWMLLCRGGLQRYAPWIVALVSAAGLWGAYMFYSPKHGVPFDNNLLNLQAKDTEAVRYEKKLIDTSLSPRAGIYMTGSVQEAERIAQEAKRLPTVQRVEWLGEVFPEEALDPSVSAALRRAILDLPEEPLAAPNLARLQLELERLKKNLEEVENQALNSAEAESILSTSEAGIEALDEILKKFPASRLDAKSRALLENSYLGPQIREFQDRFFGAVRDMLRSAASTPPMTLEELPRGIRDRFLSPDGTYAVYAFPKVDIWERQPLEDFVLDLRKVSPEVTGPPIMFFEILRLVRKDYFKAGLFSSIAIFLLFLLDFRSLRYSLLASLPLVIGVFSLFGLMSWLRLSFNTANMIALPMILGIGADNGVHIIHRFREEGSRSIDFLFKSTGKALLITYLDSVTSFLGLAFASHRGLALLGQVVVLGLTCCTIAGIFFLPAVMSILVRRRSR